MLTNISNRSLLFIILTTILILCLSSSSFFLGRHLPASSSIQTFFGWPSSIQTQYTSILGRNIDKLPTQDEAIQLFQLWRKEHGRVYSDLEEMAKKFDIFLSNLKYITESNAKRESPHDSLLGLTNFADLSAQEFKKIYLHDLDMPIDSVVTMHNDNISLPSSIDWRSKGAVTAVKNQGTCGSCWAFAATGAIEGINKIKTGNLISLSEQELVDCDSLSHGCDGGQARKAFAWVKGNGGIGSESDYPYIGKTDTCKASQTPKRVTIDEYYQATGSDDGLLSATAQQPISVSIYVVQDFQHYTGGIYYGRNCPVDSTKTNHAVLIVGYGSVGGQDYWILKNSWGTKWGTNGYMTIQRNSGKKYGVCAINVRAYYPVKNTRATI